MLKREHLLVMVAYLLHMDFFVGVVVLVVADNLLHLHMELIVVLVLLLVWIGLK
jgi:hypothetical protein